MGSDSGEGQPPKGDWPDPVGKSWETACTGRVMRGPYPIRQFQPACPGLGQSQQPAGNLPSFQPLLPGSLVRPKVRPRRWTHQACAGFCPADTVAAPCPHATDLRGSVHMGSGRRDARRLISLAVPPCSGHSLRLCFPSCGMGIRRPCPWRGQRENSLSENIARNTGIAAWGRRVVAWWPHSPSAGRWEPPGPGVWAQPLFALGTKPETPQGTQRAGRGVGSCSKGQGWPRSGWSGLLLPSLLAG